MRLHNISIDLMSEINSYICFDIYSVTIHYLENRRSNLINFLFISLIRPIEMLCKRTSLSCVKVY